MVTERDELRRRVDNIEKQNYQEVLTLVEILSNVSFFGEIKNSNCEYAKDDQCSFFILHSEEKNKIPIVAECRIKECNEPSFHCHIEISSISCALCQKIGVNQELKSSKQTSNKTKRGTQISEVSDQKINNVRKQQ